ncbi:MAG: acetylornithine/succinylornithine family transaminase [Clostridiales Family XIII bacterium]|jgi:acetylornithine/N-succinyldiaminopimelate aminotransferase|nr:acetylornithine/succinylornithine family transaminase [Clostridiales Family XIII bacterium]
MLLKDVNLTPEEVKELAKKYMVETYERFPFVACKAKGMYLYDENGVPYLDFYGGIAVNSAGSCNDKVVAAVQDQVADIMHTFNYPYTIPQAILAKLICETVGMDKIFYQNSGTESNEAMIKMARKYGVDNYGPNRYHIVTAKAGFHGRSYGALSATGQPDNACQLGFKPMLPGFTYADYNDLDSFKAAVTDDTIAIMLEPIQGEGGVIPGTKEFFQGIEKLCREKGMLLLIDEIQTGWYRTGPAMAFMNFGIKPDIFSMAKAMGGGMPIGAICATEKVTKAFNPGSHGTTYGGNPVCCAAAYAQISYMIENKLGENATEVGNYFMDKLRALPHVTEVRGAGLLVGAVLDIPKALDVKHGCIDRKLLVTSIGANVVRMVPPLIATKEDCDKAAAIIKESIEAL